MDKSRDMEIEGKETRGKDEEGRMKGRERKGEELEREIVRINKKDKMDKQTDS